MDTSGSPGCVGAGFAPRVLTHAGFHQLLGSLVDLPCTEGHSPPRDTVDFPSPDVSRLRLEAFLGGMV